MKKKLGGISLPRLGNTAVLAPETIPMPSEVRLAMSLRFAKPANLIVNVGDNVKAGQLIGEAEGTLSSPVHASISGKVKSIDNYDGLTGEKTVSVTITSEGGETADWGKYKLPEVTNLTEFIEAIKDSGAVGFGAEGYPTAHKFKLADCSRLDYILVNGLQGEPYITSDSITMVDDTEFLWKGVLLMKKHMKPKNIVICIENNKPESVKKMQELSATVSGVEVRALPSMYPHTMGKLLAYKITGRIVPEGGSLADIGCIVAGCTTVADFGRYIMTGQPLISKCITVDGSAVQNPKNVIAPIGTPLRLLFDYCGGLKDDVKKIILGGPITGTAIPSLDMPVLKNTNALLAFSEKDAYPPEPSTCIKCGRCIAQCPMGLMPPNIETAFELKKPWDLKRFRVNMCVECDCCGYVCPAKRPLAQVISLSKKILSNYEEA